MDHDQQGEMESMDLADIKKEINEKSTTFQ